MAPLNVVALISGGKDSLFSILHCIANGHNVVALANLYPHAPQGGTSVEDTDSFMYQTIGHSVIPLYEKALGLPLYRQEILGSAVNSAKDYGPQTQGQDSAKDETESLVPLLRKVMAAHPVIDAVSTGAILSDYQRTRVESVALRLGLVPLSYLWQYPSLPPATQTSLLEDMAAAGQDSRIIKVASGGMDDSFLWQNVADARTRNRLTRASQRFGTAGDGSALGEGGEYETLAIAGPAPLWKGRIVVEEGGREVVAGEAGSATVRILDASVGDCQQSEQRVRVPQLLEARFEQMLLKMSSIDRTDPIAAPSPDPSHESSAKSDELLFISDLTGVGSGAASQTEMIMNELHNRLQQAGHSFSHVAYTSIILRDMNDFAAVNASYGKRFIHPNPPARVTLSCADVLPDAALVAISATSIRTQPGVFRKGLHVQSRSYWAPANIGPYSQAISTPMSETNNDLVYIAGQIPLAPASMQLCEPCGSDTTETFLHQAILALQHLYRIGNAVKVRSWVSVIAFITAPSRHAARERAHLARRVWHAAHEPTVTGEASDESDDENFDVWDQQRGQGGPSWRTQCTSEGDGGTTRNLPTPPIAVLQVDSLPRGASIEWVAYGRTGPGKTRPHIPHLAYLLRLFAGLER